MSPVPKRVKPHRFLSTCTLFNICLLCFSTNSAKGEIVDILISGHLDANPLLEYAVRYRVDTSVPANQSENDFSSWFFDGMNGSPFMLEMEGHINNIQFHFEHTDLYSTNATQLLLIIDSPEGSGGVDSLLLGANVSGSGSITGTDFRLRQPNGSSSLNGSVIPNNGDELDLSSFSTHEFFYHNSNNQVGSGTIDFLQINIVPGPSGLVAFAAFALVGLQTRFRTSP
ncbi:MAG: hypothetical protein JJ974_08200 [Phycisphaerales bacterium]|nr:hypothetical protein [Phycisphaerales bacterium]